MAIQVKKATIATRRAQALTTGVKKAKVFRVADEATQKLLNERFSTTQNLIASRQRVNDNIRLLNDQYVRQTQDVLNDKTLGFLVQHSNIDVPTFTSIFAGYELARASRADRLNAERKEEIARLEGDLKIQQQQLLADDKFSQAQLTRIDRKVARDTQNLDALQTSLERDITDENRVASENARAENTVNVTEARLGAQERENIRSNTTSQNNNIRSTTASQNNNIRSNTTSTLNNVRSNENSAANAQARLDAAEKPQLTSFEDFMNTHKPAARPKRETESSFFDREPVPNEPELTPVAPIPQPEDAPIPPATNETPIDVPSEPGFPSLDAPATNETPIDVPSEPGLSSLDVPEELLGDEVVENNVEESPVIGVVFEDRKAFDAVSTADQQNTQTVDVAKGLETGALIYFENPETKEVVVLTDNEPVPQGFFSTGELA